MLRISADPGRCCNKAFAVAVQIPGAVIVCSRRANAWRQGIVCIFSHTPRYPGPCHSGAAAVLHRPELGNPTALPVESSDPSSRSGSRAVAGAADCGVRWLSLRVTRQVESCRAKSSARTRSACPSTSRATCPRYRLDLAPPWREESSPRCRNPRSKKTLRSRGMSPL